MKRKPSLKKLSIHKTSLRSKGETKYPLKTEMVAIDLENFKNPLICQLCLCKSENYRPLFEESSKTLMESIKSVFQIEPIQDEAVPDQICTHCVEKIDEFIAFRQMVVENHQKLQLEVEGRKDVVVFEPVVKMEESEVEEKVVQEKVTKRPLKRPSKQIKQKSASSLPSSAAPKLSAFDNDDEYDFLLKNHFTFECPRCHQTLPRFKALIHHVRTEHDMTYVSIICSQPGCNAAFEQRYKLINHLRKHGLIPPSSDFKFFCHTCGTGFEYRSGFKSHLKQASCGPISDAMFQCHYCQALYRRKGALKRHFQLNHGFVMFVQSTEHFCKECNKNYASDYSLKTHINIYHKRSKEVMCDLCAKVFAEKSALTFHYKSMHAPPSMVQCPVCGKEVKNKSALCRHLRRIHQDQPIKCEICSRDFRNRASLLTHKQRIHDPPKFICPECGKAFRVKEKQKEHMTTHGLGGERYKCEWCNKTFNFSSSKSLHKKTQHPVEWLQSRDETYKWRRRPKEQVTHNLPDSTMAADF